MQKVKTFFGILCLAFVVDVHAQNSRWKNFKNSLLGVPSVKALSEETIEEVYTYLEEHAGVETDMPKLIFDELSAGKPTFDFSTNTMTVTLETQKLISSDELQVKLWIAHEMGHFWQLDYILRDEKHLKPIFLDSDSYLSSYLMKHIPYELDANGKIKIPKIFEESNYDGQANNLSRSQSEHVKYMLKVINSVNNSSDLQGESLTHRYVKSLSKEKILNIFAPIQALELRADCITGAIAKDLNYIKRREDLETHIDQSAFCAIDHDSSHGTGDQRKLMLIKGFDQGLAHCLSIDLDFELESYGFNRKD